MINAQRHKEFNENLHLHMHADKLTAYASTLQAESLSGEVSVSENRTPVGGLQMPASAHRSYGCLPLSKVHSYLQVFNAAPILLSPYPQCTLRMSPSRLARTL